MRKVSIWECETWQNVIRDYVIPFVFNPEVRKNDTVRPNMFFPVISNLAL